MPVCVGPCPVPGNVVPPPAALGSRYYNIEHRIADSVLAVPAFRASEKSTLDQARQCDGCDARGSKLF